MVRTRPVNSVICRTEAMAFTERLFAANPVLPLWPLCDASPTVSTKRFSCTLIRSDVNSLELVPCSAS